MKFCQAHWGELKQAIRDKGMWELVAQDGEDMARRIQNDLTGNNNVSDYDPLFDSYLMISNQALKCGGLYLLNGDYCPLCEAAHHGEAGIVAAWIHDCTDAVLKHCQEENLVPKVQ